MQKIFMFFISILVCFSCGNETKIIVDNDLQEVFKKAQKKEVKTNLDNRSYVKHKFENGLILNIPPNAFEDSLGNLINEDIDIKIIKCDQPIDYIINSIYTNGLSGMFTWQNLFKIDISANGKPLKIRNGYSIGLSFPYEVNIKQRKTIYKMNNQLAGVYDYKDTLEVVTDSSLFDPNATRPDSIYDSEAGWVNKKEFENDFALWSTFYKLNDNIWWIAMGDYAPNHEECSITVFSDPDNRPAYFLFIPKYRGFETPKKVGDSCYFKIIPKGVTANLIGLYKVNDKYFVSDETFITNNNYQPELKFQEYTEDEFLKKLRSITWE